MEEEKANSSELQSPAKCLCVFGVGVQGEGSTGHSYEYKQVIRFTLAT